jgi:hypothetical protein
VELKLKLKTFDELANDSRLNELGKSYMIRVFNTSVDIILMQLKEFLGATEFCEFV